jgi:cytochrome c peroxidase
MRTRTRRWDRRSFGSERWRPGWAALSASVVAMGLVVVTLASPPIDVDPLEVQAREDPVVELGRRLFFDPGASHSKNVSCASCHAPEHGFSDARPKSLDDFGTTTRHSQTLLNLASAGPLHWDGEFASVEDLVSARTGDTRTVTGGYRPPSGPAAQNGVLKVTPVAESIAASGLYADAFEAAFGDPAPTRERLANAVAAYVRTLRSTRSAFDRFSDGETDALTAEAVRGHELFRGRAACAECHTLEGTRPSFTDGSFHNTGLARRHLAVGARRRTVRQDDGRKLVTQRDEDARSFKTPSLRDVAIRAPYMHDGSFPTLEAVVRYYAVECGQTKDDGMDPRLKPFDEGKSAAEVDRDVSDLVAFLSALTGETRAGMAESAWSKRADRIRVRVLQKDGTPYRNTVAIFPAGDVVPAHEPPAPRHLTPDAEGWIEFRPFASTHVRLSFPGTHLRPTSGEWIPDTCREGTLTLEPAPTHALAQNAIFTHGVRAR